MRHGTPCGGFAATSRPHPAGRYAAGHLPHRVGKASGEEI
jgi:hypothetical protein